ncbi:phospholipase protein (PEARLI 4) family protein [Trifolium repens]|nr:phospholipase protein (PEARLI 4) family protein [Trifolium repens]
MPPKIGKSRKQQKRKNNKMSKSRKSPISARRNLIPNSRAILDRCRSLRSSSRLQTGTTSLEQVGETHVDVEVIPLEQVAELGEVEASLSCRSNQTAGQNMFEPEAIPHEQVEEMHVENSTSGVPEKAEELGEAEMSLSSCSNQNAGQNTFEAETIPLEQEPLAEEIQASRAGCSAPCISLKLTEMVNMVRNEDDDNEVDSTSQSWLEDTVNGYKVDAEFMPILSKIIEKHGDIAKNCKGSMEYRSMLLDRICRIVYELEKKNVTNIKDKELEKQIVLVDDIKTNEVEVKWLHTRLTEIREGRKILMQLGPMKDRFDSNRESIEIAESTLKAFEDKKMEASEKLKEASKNYDEICKKEADWKEKLGRSRDKSIKISQKIENATSKVKQFLNCSLVDDLLYITWC